MHEAFPCETRGAPLGGRAGGARICLGVGSCCGRLQLFLRAGWLDQIGGVWGYGVRGMALRSCRLGQAKRFRPLQGA